MSGKLRGGAKQYTSIAPFYQPLGASSKFLYKKKERALGRCCCYCFPSPREKQLQCKQPPPSSCFSPLLGGR